MWRIAYLSPGVGCWRVELESQQTGARHVQPVNVDDVICYLTVVSEDPRGNKQGGIQSTCTDSKKGWCQK